MDTIINQQHEDQAFPLDAGSDKSELMQIFERQVGAGEIELVHAVSLTPGHAAHAARVRLVVREQQSRPGRAIRPAQHGQARPIRVEASPVVVQLDPQEHRQQDAIG